MSSKNSANNFYYLSCEVVVEIHRRQLAEFGGKSGIRSQSALESAVATPQATFDGRDLYPTAFLKAAAYAKHIAQAQAFIDGNKRAALDAALTFLSINGYEIYSEEMDLYDAMISLAEHKISKDELAELFERLASKVD